ncbi:MAG: efflux RND transporter permease subunit, partial [Saprospiraceae bacterium]
RNNIEDVSHLYIPTANGAQIPLSQVAEIKMELGPAQISREDGKRRIVVGFNIKGRDVASVVTDIQKELDEKVKLPEGYYYTYGGTFENLQAASKRLMIALPVALALIFMLLYFTFSSVKQATLIYTAIPMSAIGGVFALLIRDMPFSISAGIGFIALFGVAVLNGIVLIGTFNQLEKDGMRDILERIKEGTKIRLRPVLMTATVASFGFLPMALSHGAGAEVQKPLATVVIGGLITATFLTLFVLPLLYVMFSKIRKPMRKVSASALIAFALLSSNISYAQPVTTKTISVEDAISIALKNNLEIQSQKLNVQSSATMKKSVFELPKTNVNFQFGQYNSINQDKAFQVSQNIPFPTYFSAKSDLYKAELVSSELKQEATAIEIKAQVRYWYDQLQYLQNIKTQLQSLDSMYNDFVSAAALRYNTGATNLLEKTTVETKRGQISLLLKQNETDFAMAYNSLKTYMNTSEEFIIDNGKNYQPLALMSSFDTTSMGNNASLKVLYQQAIIAAQNKKLENASTLPDVNVGYFNQSLIGVQTINGAEVNFESSKRFQGFNVGISIPITFVSNSAKLKSLDFKQQALQKEAENGKIKLQNQLQNAFYQYNQHLSQYNYYKLTALPNADIIISTAKVGFKSGEIGYIEYLQALQTATDVQLNYLQTINQINQSIININFILNK